MTILIIPANSQFMFYFIYFKVKPWSHIMLPRLVFKSWAQKTLAGGHYSSMETTAAIQTTDSVLLEATM